MARVLGMEFGTELCEALGLKAKKVTRIVIDVPAGDVVTVTVEGILFKEDAPGVIKTLERYNLVPEASDAT